MKRNRRILLGAIIGSGILVACQGGAITYVLFYSTLVVPILSLCYVFLVYWKFCIYQNIGYMTLVKEEKVPYLFKLSNESKISYTKIQVNFLSDYSEVEDIEQAKEFFLLPGEEIIKETKLCCHYRGEYYVGINNVMVTDYLNLFRFKYASNSLIQVEVLPRVLHLNKLVIAPNSEDIKFQRFEIQTRQSIPDVEVRKYQTGDTTKMIHWKASARYGQLLTRKYTDEPKTELVVIVDFKRLAIDEKERIIIEDKLLEATLAITDYFLRNRTPVTVLCSSKQTHQFAIHNKDDFSRFYRFCSEVKFLLEEDVDQLLLNQMKQMYSKQYCILLTSQVDDKLRRVAYEYVAMENELNIVIVGDLQKETQEQNISDKIKIYRIHNSDEVKDVLEVEKE